MKERARSEGGSEGGIIKEGQGGETWRRGQIGGAHGVSEGVKEDRGQGGGDMKEGSR